MSSVFKANSLSAVKAGAFAGTISEGNSERAQQIYDDFQRASDKGEDVKHLPFGLLEATVTPDGEDQKNAGIRVSIEPTMNGKSSRTTATKKGGEVIFSGTLEEWMIIHEGASMLIRELASEVPELFGLGKKGGR